MKEGKEHLRLDEEKLDKLKKHIEALGKCPSQVVVERIRISSNLPKIILDDEQLALQLRDLRNAMAALGVKLPKEFLALKATAEKLHKKLELHQNSAFARLIPATTRETEYLEEYNFWHCALMTIEMISYRLLGRLPKKPDPTWPALYDILFQRVRSRNELIAGPIANTYLQITGRKAAISNPSEFSKKKEPYGPFVRFTQAVFAEFAPALKITGSLIRDSLRTRFEKKTSVKMEKGPKN